MGTIIAERAGHRYMLVMSNVGARLVYLNTDEELVKHRPGAAPEPIPVDPASEPGPTPTDPDHAPVEPPPVDAAPPATTPPTVGSITITSGNVVEVKGVSVPGVCFATTNNNPNALSGDTIEAAATVMFDVPAGTTTSVTIAVTGRYLHLTIKANGQYSADNPQVFSVPA